MPFWGTRWGHRIVLAGGLTAAKAWGTSRTKIRAVSKGGLHPLPRQRQTSAEKNAPARKPTPTFLLELPLRVSQGQAKRLRAHLEAARQFYNAILSEGQRRLRRMRADPAWQAARAIPHTQKQARARAFGALRQEHGFWEYALHGAAKGLNCAWIAEHVDAVLAQRLATRA